MARHRQRGRPRTDAEEPSHSERRMLGCASLHAGLYALARTPSAVREAAQASRRHAASDRFHSVAREAPRSRVARGSRNGARTQPGPGTVSRPNARCGVIRVVGPLRRRVEPTRSRRADVHDDRRLCVRSLAGPRIDGQRSAGTQEVRAAYAAVFESFHDAHWAGARHFIAGHRGVSEWTFTGTQRDGTRVEVSGCDIFTFRDGRIAVKNSYRKNRPAI